MVEINELREWFSKEGFTTEYDGYDYIGIGTDSDDIDEVANYEGESIIRICFPNSAITNPFVEFEDGTVIDLDQFPVEYLTKLIDKFKSWQW